MKTQIVRMYETEKKARSAVGRLKSEGFHDDTILLLTKPNESEGSSMELLESAVTAGFVPPDQVSSYVEGLDKGQSLVAICAPFGFGQQAIKILDSCGPVKIAALSSQEEAAKIWGGRGVPLSSTLKLRVLWRDKPAPLSDLLGRPTLSRGRTFQNKYPELKSSDWSFSSRLGYRLLSSSPEPTSAIFGFKTLSEQTGGDSWTSSFGLPMLSQDPAPLSSAFDLHLQTGPLPPSHPAPFSERLGLPTLSRGRGFFSKMFAGLSGPNASKWTFSSQLGLGLLSDDSVPASRRLGLQTISKKGSESWTASFGFPLLSRNPAPLSSKLGIELSKEPVPRNHPAPFSANLGLPALAQGPVIRSAAPLSSFIGKEPLSQDPTPLSTKLGKPVLSDGSTPLSVKVGLPLLWRRGTPLSSLFRLPVLIRSQ